MSTTIGGIVFDGTHSIKKIFEDDDVMGLRCECGKTFLGMVAFRQRLEEKAYQHLRNPNIILDDPENLGLNLAAMGEN
jgi:uncharacterized CHY-type Zn-finger protein